MSSSHSSTLVACVSGKHAVDPRPYILLESWLHDVEYRHKVQLMHTAHFSSKRLLLLQMGIANRDIKLENTLLMDLSETPVLKLCDFGYSKDELCASISKTMCGEHSKGLTAYWSTTQLSAAMASIACFDISHADGHCHKLPCTLLTTQFYLSDLHDCVLCLSDVPFLPAASILVACPCHSFCCRSPMLAWSPLCCLHLLCPLLHPPPPPPIPNP